MKTFLSIALGIIKGLLLIFVPSSRIYIACWEIGIASLNMILIGILGILTLGRNDAKR